MAVKLPTILYKLGGKHRGPNGTTYNYIGVETKKEYDEAIRNGWLSDLHKACAKKEDVKKPEKKRFHNKATGEGIETKDGKKLILGKPGVVKRKDDYKSTPNKYLINTEDDSTEESFVEGFECQVKQLKNIFELNGIYDVDRILISKYTKGIIIKGTKYIFDLKFFKEYKDE